MKEEFPATGFYLKQEKANGSCTAGNSSGNSGKLVSMVRQQAKELAEKEKKTSLSLTVRPASVVR